MERAEQLEDVPAAKNSSETSGVVQSILYRCCLVLLVLLGAIIFFSATFYGDSWSSGGKAGNQMKPVDAVPTTPLPRSCSTFVWGDHYPDGLSRDALQKLSTNKPYSAYPAPAPAKCNCTAFHRPARRPPFPVVDKSLSIGDVGQLLKSYYTLGLVDNWRDKHVNQSTNDFKPDQAFLTKIRERIKGRKDLSYPADNLLFSLADDYPHVFQDKEVVVPGSEKPQYEIWTLDYAKAASVVTLEYRMIDQGDKRLRLVLVDEYWKKPWRFDTVLAYSNFEHDGLGRYGDPYNPDGDIEAMRESWTILRDGGYLVWGGIISKVSCVCYNLHRTYGTDRLQYLFAGFNVVRVYAKVKSWKKRHCCSTADQAIVLLRKKCDYISPMPSEDYQELIGRIKLLEVTQKRWKSRSGGMA